MKAILTSLCLFLGTSSIAQTIYSWTDDDGVEHYTDDSTAIPKKARVNAMINNDASNRKVIPTAPMNLPLVAQKVETPTTEPAKTLALAETWRTLFKDARRKISALEYIISADEKKVEGVIGVPSRVSCSYLPTPVNTAQLSIQAQVGPVTVSSGFGAVQYANYNAGYPCFAVPDYEFIRAKERLEHSKIDLKNAQIDLADLERRAAREAIPLEWRS
jgi:hypothetical protein